MKKINTSIVLGTMLALSTTVSSNEYTLNDYYKYFAKEIIQHGYPQPSLPNPDYHSYSLNTEMFDGTEVYISYTDSKPFGNFGEEDILEIEGRNIDVIDKGLDGEFSMIDENFEYNGLRNYSVFPSHEAASRDKIEVKAGLVDLMSKIKIRK
jgi:hypothetical protein